MKNTEIVEGITKDNNIDWSEQQWVVCDDKIVMTNGEHEGISFTGTVLPCDSYPGGYVADYWTKGQFNLMKKPLTIIISN